MAYFDFIYQVVFSNCSPKLIFNENFYIAVTFIITEIQMIKEVFMRNHILNLIKLLL